jgi:hypothetical protein
MRRFRYSAFEHNLRKKLPGAGKNCRVSPEDFADRYGWRCPKKEEAAPTARPPPQLFLVYPPKGYPNNLGV